MACGSHHGHPSVENPKEQVDPSLNYPKVKRNTPRRGAEVDDTAPRLLWLFNYLFHGKTRGSGPTRAIASSQGTPISMGA